MNRVTLIVETLTLMMEKAKREETMVETAMMALSASEEAVAIILTTLTIVEEVEEGATARRMAVEIRITARMWLNPILTSRVPSHGTTEAIHGENAMTTRMDRTIILIAVTTKEEEGEDEKKDDKVVEEAVLEDSTTIITNLITMSITTESMSGRSEENLGMNIIINKLPHEMEAVPLEMEAVDGMMSGEHTLLDAVNEMKAKNH